MNWYAVYTKNKCEQKFSALLNKKKIVNYCPMNLVSKDDGPNRHKHNPEPLFPNFVFVQTTEDRLDFIRQCSDVINMVYWLGRPVQIRSVEIDNIREFVSSYTNIKLEKTEVSLQKMNRVISKFPAVRTEENVAIMTRTEIKLNLPGLGFILHAFSDVYVNKLEQSDFFSEAVVS
jgi:transcription antitermination factor NusG